MKRFLIVLFIAILIPSGAYAQENNFDSDTYNEYLSDYDFSFFEDTLDRNTYELLEELGVESFDPSSITSLEFEDLVNILKNILIGKLETPLESAFAILVFILLSSFFQSFKTEGDSSMSSLFSTASSLIIAVVLLIKIGKTISVCAATIGLASDFIYAFIPVFCAITASSGGVTTTFSTNSLLLILSQGLSFVSSNVFVPLINCFTAIGICSGIRSELNLGRVISSLKRCITSIISFLAAAFVSILSIKTAVASRADALGLRSVRFAINSVVPVIGSAISEGLLSIQSYSSLIKSSVGVVGIVAVALVFLPGIIEVVIWRFMLSICIIISDVFGDNSVSLVLKAFRDSMLLINVILILSMVTTVISIGILIAAKTG